MGKRSAQRLLGLTLPLPDDSDPGAGGGGTPPPAPTAPSATSTVTMTQDELSRKMTAESEKGGRAAVAKLAEELGMSPAEAVEFVKKAKADAEAAKSEEQKRQDALAAKEKEIAAKEAAAQAREFDLRNRAALVSAGATGENLEDAAALLARRVDADADEAKVTAAVEELKKTRAELFTAPTTRPAGTPPAAPPKPGTAAQTGEFGADGAAEAARRFGKKEPATAST